MYPHLPKCWQVWFLLVQDNASFMWSECRQFLDDECIDAIDWPSRSSNLRPIEILWDVTYWIIWSTTDCPGAHWCPDPSSHQEHVLMLSGVHTVTWRPNTLLITLWAAVMKFMQDESFCTQWNSQQKCNQSRYNVCVTRMTRRETFGSKCKLFIWRHGQYRQGRAGANRYGMGKTEE